MKAILAVKHGKVPPSLHHHTPNPEIDWAGLRLSVPTALAEWPRDRAGAPRRAGVIAFTSPAMPAAASVCPIFVLTDPTGSGLSRPVASTCPIASSSTGSPLGVPVPCAST
ncbi:MAG: hypothetical protein AAFV49_01670 [Pseudomonadota bacterium]